MIRIATNREPVTVHLRPPYGDVGITLRRLTSADYGEARQAAQAILRNDAELLNLLVKHDTLPAGGVKGWKRMKDDDALSYAAFLSGVGIWIGSVECALRGVLAWTGVVAEDGSPVPVSRDALETLMLDEALSSQVMAELDKAARILIIEGEPFGASPSGSSERETTASAPTTAPAA